MGHDYVNDTCTRCGHTIAHVHNYTASVVAPTCTTGGYTVYTCFCGDSYQDNETPATGHSYSTVVVEPTCTENGYTAHICSCGDRYHDNEVPFLGHDFVNRFCTRCNAILPFSHTHTYITISTVAPTCIENGYTVQRCVCGDTQSVAGEAALGHDFVDGICSRCGNDGSHIHVFNITLQTVAPTCTAGGYTLMGCECGETKQTNVVAPLGHNVVLGRCTRCSGSFPIIPPSILSEGELEQTEIQQAEPVLESTVTSTYRYVYNGSQLSQLVIFSQTTTGSAVTEDTETLNFAYDASGAPMAVVYNGTTYYYTTNIQGDVTAILNSSGTAVVTYTYDAWGNILTTSGTMASTLGVHNPLRYRGYVYDHETGLYYLQSRYYDPAIGRFISADAFVSTGQGLLGNNMFAYCLNNPVNYIDPTGACPHDGRFYTSGPFEGQFEYNPNCKLCAAHGEFWLQDINGNLYDLTQYELHTYEQMAICTDGGTDPHNSATHQKETAYSVKGRYMDPTLIHYVVAPVGYQNVSNGDLALVIDNETGNSVFAVVGDRGPKGMFNEVSLLVAWDLGYNWADGSRGPKGNFSVLYFPGTKHSWQSIYDLADYLR